MSKELEAIFRIEQITNKELKGITLTTEEHNQRAVDLLTVRSCLYHYNELKKTVKAFIDNHVAYPYDEDGVAYDDEYTKDYEELLDLCKGSEE